VAFLAPDLVRAAIDGRFPQGIGVARLFDAPVDVVAPAENAQVGALILVLCTSSSESLGGWFESCQLPAQSYVTSARPRVRIRH
jgi:hypothetical protein